MTSPLTVLIADDDPAVRELHRLYIESEYRVETVADGGQALDVDPVHIDVVVLDRDMPGASGDRVARTLRADGFYGPIAMVTGSDPDSDVEDLPIDEYVTKPLDRAEFRSLVDRLVRSAPSL